MNSTVKNILCLNGFANEITFSLAFGRPAAKRRWCGHAAAGKPEAMPKSASGTLVPARRLQLPRACAMAGELRQVRASERIAVDALAALRSTTCSANSWPRLGAQH